MTKGILPTKADNPPQKGEMYKHYKGDTYEIIGMAIHSNDDIWMVVYKPLYDNADADLFTRPLADWREKVEWEGEIVDRFSLILI